MADKSFDNFNSSGIMSYFLSLFQGINQPIA